MKRIAWALIAPAVIFACATEVESVDLGALPDAGLPEFDASVDANSPSREEPAEAAAPVCGDGKKDAKEDCDDGNTKPNDGCSATCTVETSGPNDLCPGVAIPLTGTGDQLRTGQVVGKTTTVWNQYAGSCGGSSGTDAVYVVTSPVTGLLKARLTSDFDSAIYARRTCDDANTEAACNDAPGATGGEQLKVSVNANEPVYLFVDGYAGSNGNFTLDVEVEKASCGNGVAELPEVCDDGNNVAGDGCAPDCTLESGGVIADCPGQDILLKGSGTAVRHVSIANTTTGLSSNSQSPSVCSGSGYNHIYAVTPDVSGTITAKYVASFSSASLHVRKECNSAFLQLDCNTTASALAPIEINQPVVAGIPMYFIADSMAVANNGAYTIDFTLTPAACGNHLLDPNEQCDDGNAVDGDGCSQTCTLEPLAGITACPGNDLGMLKAGTDPKGKANFSAMLTSSTATSVSSSSPKITGSGCSTVANTVNDAIFTFKAPETGRLNAKVAGEFDSMLYVRTGVCGSAAVAANELACSGSSPSGGSSTPGYAFAPESLDVDVNKDQVYYVIVDGESNSLNQNTGVFELALTLTPRECGNAYKDIGEACDDGNLIDGDGCSATCTMETVAADTCQAPGSLTLLNLGDVATKSSGITNLANNQEFTVCGGAGKDAFYAFTPAVDGVVTVNVTNAAFDAVVGARAVATTADCPAVAASSGLACANDRSDGSESVVFGVQANKTYQIIVDSRNASDLGPFSLSATLSAPRCGDKLISGSEKCDDGNTVGGDGCSSDCMTLEPLAGVDTCGGYTLALTGGAGDPRSGQVSFDTTAFTGNYAGTCGGNSADGVIAVVPPISGKLTARLTGYNYNPVLYARGSCADAATEMACTSDRTNATNTRDITVSNVTAGTPVYLFVDGYNSTFGIGLLNVTVTP